jgi:hypothetical protein
MLLFSLFSGCLFSPATQGFSNASVKKQIPINMTSARRLHRNPKLFPFDSASKPAITSKSSSSMPA